MEDNFRVRVDKAFGSLSTSSPSSSMTATTTCTSTLSSLWCLADDEIEKKEWNRDKGSPEPETMPNCKLSANNWVKSPMEKDLDELQDDDYDEEEEEDGKLSSSKPKPDDYNDEEWEIRNNIGLDSTLDYEEEEDEYDKVAVGRKRDDAEDRFYMKGASDYGVLIDSGNELPNSFKEVVRDPRANHLAAKIRLNEDAEAAKKMDSLRVSDKDSPAVVNDRVHVSGDGNLKSILKRKDDEVDSKSNNNQLDAKSRKRVRFDSECKDADDGESNGVNAMDSTEDAMVYQMPPDYPSGIPDYMRNPSKYTRYDFDSGDLDEESNRRAYTDFLKILKRSNDTESQVDDGPVDLPKSLTFIPKRKGGDVTMADNSLEFTKSQDGAAKESLLRRGLPVGIAAADTEDSEVCAMEEDELETVADKRNSSQRASRQYRTKSNSAIDEST